LNCLSLGCSAGLVEADVAAAGDARRMSGGRSTVWSEARALEPTWRCPGVVAVSSSPDDNPLRAAACVSSSRAIKLRAGIPVSSAISSAQLEAIYVRSEDPQQVRGEHFRPCTMRPAVEPSYGLFVERSANPIDNPSQLTQAAPYHAHQTDTESN